MNFPVFDQMGLEYFFKKFFWPKVKKTLKNLSFLVHLKLKYILNFDYCEDKNFSYPATFFCNKTYLKWEFGNCRSLIDKQNVLDDQFANNHL